MKRINHKPGFTFVELLFAIVVMGILFSIALVVFVGMLRFYVFAGFVRQNQENGRNVLDSITREARFAELISPSTAGSLSQKICFYDPNSKKIIGYIATGLGTATASLNRFESTATYDSYNTASSSSNDCGDSTKGSLRSVLPNSMYPVAFDVIRTGGAKATTYNDVAAVTIGFAFITQTAGTISTSCDVVNIYCNKNTYNTALELRGNIQPSF